MFSQKENTGRVDDYIQVNTTNAHLTLHLVLLPSVNGLRVAGSAIKAALQGALNGKQVVSESTPGSSILA